MILMNHCIQSGFLSTIKELKLLQFLDAIRADGHQSNITGDFTATN